ncbi:hypothetical protein SDJN02_18915 [Cucurbita argyrosperma subsp. argyrosperma]|nr:hypothetical protein SDJN02_18915 [Cucurbita argyrosperma subsp. argyrosperma]
MGGFRRQFVSRDIYGNDDKKMKQPKQEKSNSVRKIRVLLHDPDATDYSSEEDEHFNQNAKNIVWEIPFPDGVEDMLESIYKDEPSISDILDETPMPILPFDSRELDFQVFDDNVLICSDFDRLYNDMNYVEDCTLYDIENSLGALDLPPMEIEFDKEFS